jgi:hypothetical protein
MSVGVVLTKDWKSVLRSIIWVFICSCTSINLYSDFKKEETIRSFVTSLMTSIFIYHSLWILMQVKILIFVL